MVIAASPNRLGSPQHFVVGAIAAVVAYFAARSRWLALPEWLAFVLAVSLVSTAELVLELVEAAVPIPLRRRFPILEPVD
jgi:hypothetical protein